MKKLTACLHPFLLAAGIFISSLVQAQTKTLRGKILTEDNLPLQGVNITIKGKTTGVQTAADGSFVIEAAPDDVLQVSYLGYEPKEVTVGASNSLDLSLKIADKKNGRSSGGWLWYAKP